MQRVNLDAAPPAVREFVSALPVEPDGVELEIDGQVVCKVIGRNQLSEQERDAIMAEGLKLIRQSQQRNEGVVSTCGRLAVTDELKSSRRPSS